MKSRLIAAVAAASLALTSMAATPAQALSDRERDALKIIAGAVILGAIINEAQKDKKEKKRKRDPEPVRYRNRIVPAACVYDVKSGKGRRDVVSRACMEDYGLARRLPADCAFEIRTNRGNRLVYGPRCLEDYGYRIEGVRY